MSLRVVVVVSTSIVAGCSLISYPDNPPAKVPISIQEAVERAQALEAKYLATAGDQVVAAKLTNFALLASAATGIGAALFGAHRDIVTGAAFTGGVVYTGSTLLGSPIQRSVYRTGAQALSCAIVKVMPLMRIDDASLKSAYDLIRQKDPEFRKSMAKLDGTLRFVALPDLADNSFARFKSSATEARIKLDAAATEVDKALLPNATDASSKSATDAIAGARSAIGMLSLAKVETIAILPTLTSTADIQRLKNVSDRLNALRKSVDKTKRPLTATYIENAQSRVENLSKEIQIHDETWRTWAETIIVSRERMFLTEYDLLNWRMMEPALRTTRTNALRVHGELTTAGTNLSQIVDKIHIKVLNELERAEPSQRSILEALSSSTGMTLNIAKTAADQKNAVFPRTIGTAQGGVAQPQTPEIPAPSGEVSPQPSRAPGGTVEAAPAAEGVTEEKEVNPEIRKEVDTLTQPLPTVETIDRRLKSMTAVVTSLVASANGIATDHNAALTAATDLANAQQSVSDILETTTTVNFNAIETECERLLNPGIKPLMVDRNFVTIEQTGENSTAYVYVYGGIRPFSAHSKNKLIGLDGDMKADPRTGEPRYEVKAATGFTAGQNYEVTIIDGNHSTATFTITTK